MATTKAKRKSSYYILHYKTAKLQTGACLNALRKFGLKLEFSDLV